MPISAASLRTTFPVVFDAVPDAALSEAIAAAYLQLSAAEWGDRLDLAASYLAADLAMIIVAAQSGVAAAAAAGASAVAAGPVSMSFAPGGGSGGALAHGGAFWSAFEKLMRGTIVPILGY